MPDEERVQELYAQMIEHQHEINAIDSNGNMRSSVLLAAAYIVAAIEKTTAE